MCGPFGSSGTSSTASRFNAHKNADRVLPVPVGARIRVWSPFAIAGQPLRCGAVASRKVEVNHSRTGSANAANGSLMAATYRYSRTPSLSGAQAQSALGSDEMARSNLAQLHPFR